MNPTDSPRRRKRGQGAASGAPTLPPSPRLGRGAGGEGLRPGLPRWADALLTLWVAAVAVLYFGGYFWPETIGVYTATGRTLYAALLLIAVTSLTLRYLNRANNENNDTQGHAHED